MTFEPHPVRVTSPQKDDERSDLKNEELTPKTNHQPHIIAKDEPILCPHCLRTASNGIKCKGICVAESDYWAVDSWQRFALLGKAEGLANQESEVFSYFK